MVKIKIMNKLEQQGNPQIQVMDLIVQLENKVREKNQIIEQLRDESDDWRRKFIIGTMIGYRNPLPFGIGAFIGCILTLVAIHYVH